ncbi:hypothetical protein VNO78_15146 [Psophocarpus tetragonolobus]|uniref:Uncharacterized protein n=1 Tax=Psophocarpus tetragonolobus TaxID=3891 RepID=A0AAN9SDL8_PSOTE
MIAIVDCYVSYASKKVILSLLITFEASSAANENAFRATEGSLHCPHAAAKLESVTDPSQFRFSQPYLD